MNESILNTPALVRRGACGWNRTRTVARCSPTTRQRPSMKISTASPQDISPENVSVAAYHRWLAAGKPSGRDHEFWLKAEMDLRKMVSQIPQASYSPMEPRTAQPHRTERAGPARVPGAQRDKHNPAFAMRGPIPRLP
jgi:hypothetical protein